MAEKKLTEAVEEQPGFVAKADNNARTNLQEADKRRSELTKHYQDQDKVPMYLSPMYRPYFGNVMRVMINGISIYFKVDGSTQLVPQTFADEITARRLAVDATIMKQRKMENVSSNYETAPGDLKIL